MTQTCVPVFVLALALGADAAAGQSANRPVAPSSGRSLCDALRVADFVQAGVPVTALREANLDADEGAYCVYDGAAGRVEFDIFFPAGANAGEVRQTERTAMGEGGTKYEAVTLAGADSTHLTPSFEGKGTSAFLVARAGRAVIALLVPAGPQARSQLLALATVAIGRLEQ
jgi:hypothetical protein